MTDDAKDAAQARGLVAVDGAIALIAILLIVQIWLLTTSLDAFLAGHTEAALPGLLVSGAIFLACLGLYLFIERIDNEVRTRSGGLER